MKEKIMKIVSESILLSLFLISCTAAKPLVTESTDIEVHERFVPVVTNKINVAAFAKIEMQNGIPYISNLKVLDNVQSDTRPKVDVHIDENGILQVEVEVAPDTLNIAIADTTKHTQTTITKEVEKDLNGIQKFLILAGVVSIVYYVCKKKYKKM